MHISCSKLCYHWSRYWLHARPSPSHYLNGLVQDCSIFSTLAMKILQFCTNIAIWTIACTNMAIWTIAKLLLIGAWGTNFSDIWVKIEQFSIFIKKMNLKMLLALWQPFCLGHNVSTFMIVSYFAPHLLARSASPTWSTSGLDTKLPIFWSKVQKVK